MRQVAWPQWNFSAPQLLNFEANQTSTTPDTFRTQQYNAILGEYGSLRI